MIPFARDSMSMYIGGTKTGIDYLQNFVQRQMCVNQRRLRDYIKKGYTSSSCIVTERICTACGDSLTNGQTHGTDPCVFLWVI
jgi:hypothetical protein